MLIAHIGRGKCGSTSLQYALHTQRLQLLDQGIYVPKTAHAGNHYGFVKDLTSDAEPPLALSGVANSLRNPAYTSTVVSSEFLLDLDANSVQNLVSSVPRSSIRAIIYLRDYVSWLPSLYSQKTKKGRLKQDFDWYFEREFKNKVSILPQVKVWISCIGAENLLIRQMQDGLIDGISILQDMGLQIGAALVETERKNTTPHWWAVEFRRAIVKLLPSPDPATEQAIDFAMRQFDARARHNGIGSACYLTEEQIDRLRDLYRSDIRALHELLGHPAEEQFSRIAAPREGSEPPSLATVPTDHIAEVAAICAKKLGPQSTLVQALHTLVGEACSRSVNVEAPPCE